MRSWPDVRIGSAFRDACQTAATSWRFLLVGILCAGLHNSVLIVGDAGGLGYAAASILSHVIVIPTAYLLHIRFTFREQGSWRSLARYAVTMTANLPVSVFLLFVLCDVAHLSIATAGPVATLLVFGLNYLTCRWSIGGARAPALREA